MARTVRDSKIETREARRRLDPRNDPYYRGIEPGLALGYRKPKGGSGAWLARRLDAGGKYSYHPLGTADDFSDADGKVILSYAQAQKAAREVQVGRGIGTVGEAAAAYLKWMEDEGRSPSAIQRTRYAVETHILSALGETKLTKLTQDQFERWFTALARKPARIRTRKGEAQRYRTDRDDDEDGKRSRRASANRIRTTLVAILNRAFRRGQVDSDLAWRRVEPFKGADAARVRWLTVAEAKRLINVARLEFQPLLQAALLSGARYGSLIILVASDFDPDSGTLRLRTRKGDGSWRIWHVHLNDEAQTFFRSICAGRRGNALMFTHADGRPWKKSHQQIPMAEACERAGIVPAVSFNVIRHTYATLSAKNDLSLDIIAESLGHTSTRMVQKHYRHFVDSHIRTEVRKKTPRFGIKPGNVRPLR